MNYRITEKKILGKDIFMVKINAPQIAQKHQPGQFIILRLHEKGERIPLTIADSEPEAGNITLVVQVVGKTTRELNQYKIDDTILDLFGPLGKPTDIAREGTIAAIGGGLGIAPLHPILKALKNSGNKTLTILGARSKEYLFWEDKMKALSDELYVTTDDGSYGEKGLVTAPLENLIKKGTHIDRVYCIGPVIMMKAVSTLTREYDIPTIVSLNPIMVDGTGMCGGCRVTVGNKTLFACVDGPEFDGHLVNFDELHQRLQFYKSHEKIAESQIKDEQHHCKLGDMDNEKG